MPGKRLSSPYRHRIGKDGYQGCVVMEKILQVLSIFIAFFVIVDGIYVYVMPPYGDEPVAAAIILIGIFIPILTFSVARWEHVS